jgi:hypothetical protein
MGVYDLFTRCICTHPHGKSWLWALQAVSQQDKDALKKRKLIVPETQTMYKVSKGPKFALQRRRAFTDLTHDMLQR